MHGMSAGAGGQSAAKGRSVSGASAPIACDTGSVWQLLVFLGCSSQFTAWKTGPRGIDMHWVVRLQNCRPYLFRIGVQAALPLQEAV